MAETTLCPAEPRSRPYLTMRPVLVITAVVKLKLITYYHIINDHNNINVIITNVLEIPTHKV